MWNIEIKKDVGLNCLFSTSENNTIKVQIEKNTRENKAKIKIIIKLKYSFINKLFNLKISPIKEYNGGTPILKDRARINMRENK